VKDAVEEDRLHGSWNDTGTRRWCVDCGVWVRLEDWQLHKRDVARALTDGGRDQSTEEVDRASASIAREHLLGATVWAYVGGAARVRPWTTARDIRMPARLDR
jgi:hypothetical protein